MTSFDYRMVFGVTGNDEWVPGVHRRGATHSGEAHRLLGDTPALSGLVGQPQGSLCAKIRKSKEKKKKEGRSGKGGGLLPPNQVQLGLGGGPPPLGSADPLGIPWTPRQGPPPSSYIYGAFRADLRRLSHGCPTTYLHSFSSRSCFCGARAEPC